MKLTEAKLKELILEIMEDEEEPEELPEEEKKELVQIVMSQLLDTSSPEIFEQMKELLESSGVPLEQVGNYMDPQAIADKITNTVDNNLDEVKLAADAGEDLTDLGASLGSDLAAYMNNLISSNTRPEWAPLLVTARGEYNQDYLFSSWLRNKHLLTDDQLTKLYQSASPNVRAQMERSKKLAEFPGVSKAIADRLALKKSGSSRLRMSLRRKK